MKEDTNVVTVIGRLTEDAELKYSGTQFSGMPIGFFTIANNRKKKENGNYVEEASYFGINVYGKYAETIIPSLKKDVQVCVVGSIRQERWADRAGQNKSRVVITANSVQILGGRQ